MAASLTGQNKLSEIDCISPIKCAPSATCSAAVRPSGRRSKMTSKTKESCDDDQYLQSGKRDIRALVRLWCKQQVSFFVETLEVYAKKLIDTYLKTVGDGFRPSNELEMMAEVFRPDVEDQILEVPGRLTQLELCDHFWKKMCSVYHASLAAKGIAKDANVLKEEARNFFEKLALRALYPDGILEKEEHSLQHCDYVGIGLTTNSGKGFVYDSIGDYFAALYFIKTLQQPERPVGFEDFFFGRVLGDEVRLVPEFFGALIRQNSIEPNVQVSARHAQYCAKYLHNLEEAMTDENSEKLGIFVFLYRCVKKHVEQFPVEERRSQMEKYVDDWLIGHYIQCAVSSENDVALQTLFNIGVAEQVNLEAVIKHLFYNDELSSLVAKPALQHVTEQMLDYLIKGDIDVTCLLRPTRDASFLAKAVHRKNTKLVDWILNFAVEHGLSSDTLLIFDDVCNSPLHVAAKLGFEDIFKKILAFAVDTAANGKLLLSPNEAGRGLLHQAAQGGNECIVRTVVQFSIDSQVDPTSLFTSDKTGRSPFHLAVSAPKSKKSEGASKCAKVVDEMFVLASEKNIDLTQSLAQDQWGMSPVYLAARNGLASVVEIIFEHSKKMEIDCSKFFGRTRKGETPLHAAAERGHVQVIESLLRLITENDVSAGKVMKTDDDEETPLSYAVYGGHGAVAELLLDFAFQQKVSLRTLLSGFGDDLDYQARKRLARCNDVSEMAKIIFGRIKPRDQDPN